MDPDERSILAARLSAAEAKVRETAEALLTERRQARAAERRAEKAERIAQRTREERDMARTQFEAIRSTRWWRLREALRAGRRDPRRLALGVARSSKRWPTKTAPVPAPLRQVSATRRPVLATILDPFSASAFAGDADLLQVRPFDWEPVVTERRPDLLLVESAWGANAGTWGSRLDSHEGPLADLLAWCRSRAIPTVFWNKEDPVHHERFAPIALAFDQIFTTDEGCVERYERGGSAGRVGVLTFAAQPRMHNPITIGPRAPLPCFAGTYYRGRDPEQLRRFEELLDAARPHGLEIFERTFGQDGEQFGFPERFAPHIVGSLPYDEMVRAYKRYRVFLNGSSSPTSRTMIPRRIPELLACGTAIVSTPHRGIEHLFGGSVTIVEDEASADAALKTLLHDDPAFRGVTRAGLRRVFAAHTVAHQLEAIMSSVGLDFDAASDRRVTGLSTLGPKDAERTLAGQTRPIDAIITGEDLRLLAARAETPWVASLDHGSWDATLLEDLTNAASYTRADIIGRGSIDSEERFDRQVVPALARREVVVAHGWPTADSLDGLFAQGSRIYRGPAPD